MVCIDLVSNGGRNILVGDTLRGINAVDLTGFNAVQNSRQQIDTLISDLSIRLSALGYDTAFYLNYTTGQVPKIPLVGCDNITTDVSSNAFVTGDILTIMGRSHLGGVFLDPLNEIPAALERLKDIELVLLELHMSLYEIHLDLLKRGLEDVSAAQVQDQEPLDSLKLGNDVILSQGADTVVGDAATLYFQVDRLGVSGFEFTAVDKSTETNLKALLKAVTDARDEQFDNLVETMIPPSEPIKSSEVAFADVPFLTSVGTDNITLADNEVLVVGDFATIGMTFSQSGTPTDLPSTSYAESIEILRLKPSVASFLYRLR